MALKRKIFITISFIILGAIALLIFLPEEPTNNMLLTSQESTFIIACGTF